MSAKLTDYTAEQIVGLFNQYKLTPIRGKMFRSCSEACALGAIYKHETGIGYLPTDEDNNHVWDYMRDKYGYDAIENFYKGFDTGHSSYFANQFGDLPEFQLALEVRNKVFNNESQNSQKLAD